MPTDRQTWPDAAKATCILLVACFHFTGTRRLYQDLPWVDAEPWVTVWQNVNQLMTPVRIPTFFLISGYFAARDLHRPFAGVVRRRIANPYWTYVVWLLLVATFFSFGPDVPVEITRVEEVLLAMVISYTWLWYLYALPLFFVVVRLGRRWPTATLLGAVGLALLADTRVVPHGGTIDSLPANLVFFAVGALAPQVVDRLAGRSTVLLAVVATAAYACAAEAANSLDLIRAFGLSTVLSVMGAATGVMLAVQLARALPRAAGALAWMGRRTLPIYVMHMPLLYCVTPILARIGERNGLFWSLLTCVTPALVVVTVGVLAVGVHTLLMKAQLRVLFAAPAARTVTA